MNQSETIGKLAEALAKAQGSMEGAKKDSKNPFFKSSYADLESVWTACRRSLCENGLSVVQTTQESERGVCLVTTLLHSSGEWLRGIYPISPAKNDPQGVGSALTYARRYALAALVGVCQTDDDGEAAMGPFRGNHQPATKVESWSMNQAQSRELNDLIAQDAEGGKIIRSRLKIQDVRNIRGEEYNKVFNWLKQRKEERENGKSKVAAMA